MLLSAVLPCLLFLSINTPLRSKEKNEKVSVVYKETPMSTYMLGNSLEITAQDFENTGLLQRVASNESRAI